MGYKFFVAPEDEWAGLYDPSGKLIAQSQTLDEHDAAQIARSHGGLDVYQISAETYDAYFAGIGFPKDVSAIEPFAEYRGAI